MTHLFFIEILDQYSCGYLGYVAPTSTETNNLASPSVYGSSVTVSFNITI